MAQWASKCFQKCSSKLGIFSAFVCRVFLSVVEPGRLPLPISVGVGVHLGASPANPKPARLCLSYFLFSSAISKQVLMASENKKPAA
ncbi:MAG: hypothetical protein HKO75_01610 [Flavobacteriaceae bacterium]|nr:hypothetical protein [Muriicola sp.]NNL38533.1 hypothetical protein [Flavobacteriaceae bacterium]